jgi:hypothetical protein
MHPTRCLVSHSKEAGRGHGFGKERFGIRRRETFQTEQRFQDYEDLLAKIGGQGRVAIERAQRFAVTTDIVIPMDYQLARLS